MLPLPSAAAMDYKKKKGDFHAGFQEVDGIPLGYLQVEGTRMFALTQVFRELFHGVPRAALRKAMESLPIRSRRCDLKELRTLKAIQSVPSRAVQCSLISQADLDVLRRSCRAASPRRRKRKRKSKRRGFRKSPGSGGKRGAPLPPPPPLPPPAGKAYAYPRDLQLPPDAARAKLPSCNCLAKRPRLPGSKREGTSAGYSSDSDSSSLATTSDSSEEEEEEEEEDSSCSESSSSSSSEEEEGSSSASESSSLCSGDSVQSTRFRQAALPRLPPQAPSAASAPALLLPAAPKALRPEPGLLFWARALRVSTLGTGACKAAPKKEPEPKPCPAPPPPRSPSREALTEPSSPGGGGGGGGGGRQAQFDRLIRQSKLWCYAKGFDVGGGGAGLRRSQIAAPKGQGRPGKAAGKRGAPARPPFTLMGSFPCTPALVVGADGDLCPASSLCVKDSRAPGKTHPLWAWRLGGHAVPVPPSLKFRGYAWEEDA